MKIAIISDLHDNLATLDLFFKIAKEEKIEKIICCGDVGNLESLSYLSSSFTGEISLVYGNAEMFQAEDVKQFNNINFLGRYGQIEIDNIKIGLCHEPYFLKNLISSTPDLDYIFYGHTHKPWISQKNKIKLINPGTLGGIFYRPSFAIFDTANKNIKLKLIK